MSDTFIIALSGLGMGFFGSMPPTGPVALMTISRAFRKRLTEALAVSVGGALGEAVYAALAVTGVGLLLREVELAHTLVRGLSTLVLLAVGVYFFVTPLSAEDLAAQQADGGEGSAWVDLGRGFTISLFNPTLIVNWTVAVAFFFSFFGLDADLVGQAVFVVSVTVGIIAWMALQVWLLDKFQQRFSVELLGTIQRAVSVLVIGAAVYLGYETLAGL